MRGTRVPLLEQEDSLMKVKNFVMLAGLAFAFGMIGCLVMGALAVLLAGFQGNALGTLPVIALNALVWWMTVWGARNMESIIQYDAAGIRFHGTKPWDIPWAHLKSLVLEQRQGDRYLWVTTLPGTSPSRVVPYLEGDKPSQPADIPDASGPRVVARLTRLRSVWQASLGGLLLTAYLVIALLGGPAQSLAILAGVAGGALLAFGLPRSTSLTVVDWHGIRRIGHQKNWTLPWSQILSAQVTPDNLIVQPLEDPDQGAGVIQDSFRPEDQTEGTAPRGFGFLQRLASRSAQREALAGEGLTTAPIRPKDAAALQAAIDEHLGALEARATAMIEPADPTNWPQLGDLERDPAEKQDEYQPGEW